VYSIVAATVLAQARTRVPALNNFEGDIVRKEGRQNSVCGVRVPYRMK
jgi:hypothetical protein